MKNKILALTVVSLFMVSVGATQNIQETQEPDVRVIEDQVTTTVHLENTGEDMQENWIIEQDPILLEEDDPWWQLVFVGAQETCDPDNPQTVHKDYQLQNGEETSITLQSRNLDPGTYNLKLISATGCTTEEDNVVSTSPYGWRDVPQQITVEGDQPSIEAYRDPSLSINNETGEVTGTVYLENTGDADMERDFIVEMQLRDRTGQLLSTIGSQGTCDPSSPENVHKTYSLDSGDREDIVLTSEVPEAGVYDVKFVTATECMTDGEGIFVNPYVQGVSDYTFEDVAVSKGGNPPGINFTAVAIGGAVILGGILLTIFGLRRLDIIG